MWHTQKKKYTRMWKYRKSIWRWWWFFGPEYIKSKRGQNISIDIRVKKKTIWEEEKKLLHFADESFPYLRVVCISWIWQWPVSHSVSSLFIHRCTYTNIATNFTRVEEKYDSLFFFSYFYCVDRNNYNNAKRNIYYDVEFLSLIHNISKAFPISFNNNSLTKSISLTG